MSFNFIPSYPKECDTALNLVIKQKQLRIEKVQYRLAEILLEWGTDPTYKDLVCSSYTPQVETFKRKRLHRKERELLHPSILMLLKL